MWIAIIVAYALNAFVPQQAALPRQIDLHWVYVRDGLKWESPPKGTTEGLRYSNNAFLAVLFPSGEYVGVFPVLYRDEKTGHISISRGDGMVIRKGRWEKGANGSIHIKSSIVYTPIPQGDKNYPYDEKDEEWMPSGSAEGRVASKLKTPKSTLIPLENFTDLEFLSNYIMVEGSQTMPSPTAH
jgi:hypothetical protein